MRAELTTWAKEDRRKLHALILIVLDDALQARRAAPQEPTSAKTASRLLPTAQERIASLAEVAS